ncbi:hypothetical protein SAMN02990966_02614 [Rhodospirillales bacterium URHD0017]|nr:hypothetical protein SAMN02990966_02614 [Rhodospirillales bacterium URHD0017]
MRPTHSGGAQPIDLPRVLAAKQRGEIGRQRIDNAAHELQPLHAPPAN